VIDLTSVPQLLEEHLPAHLGVQRWAGAHGRPFASARFRWQEVVCDDDEVVLVWGLVDAVHEDGEAATFQVFVGLRPVADPPEFLEGKERELIGELPGDDGPVLAYDALVDPDLAVAVLHLVAPDQEVQVRRPIVLEHSNSSVVFDEDRILKLIRRVEPGANPDMEITRELALRGLPHVLPPLAELRRGDTDLAVLREFLVGATEGWVLARTSMRDLLASRLPPEECGGDLAPDMERLGAAVGELHVVMGDVWGAEPGDVQAWVTQMRAQLEQVEGLAAPHRELATHAEAVRDRYDRLSTLEDVGAQIRIHGDLHLAQVLRADDGWRILDFEGEPARRRDDRFTVSSPLRDVAGILRSLHYAAAVGLEEWDGGDGELTELADAWEERNREAFLAGYAGVPRLAALLPSESVARREVLAAFELDKAVYELAYELQYRPDQVGIPAAGIQRLVGAGAWT
jgi:maltokinase